MNSSTDQQLLRDFARLRSEAAFTELARRHVDFVYSAALRMVRDAHLAQDVTQSVFVALAQNASRLTERLSLSGWLHRTAQNLAANVVRSEVRRRNREYEAVAMNELPSTEPEADWEQIAPLLDSALGELSEADRDVIFLRYFQKKSAREIAQSLGISDDAAQKRLNRAVDRLRELFAKRGVAAGATGLAAIISAHAIQAAPAGLVGVISSSALLSSAAPIIATSLTKTIVMTTIQKIAAIVTVAAVGAGIFEARQAAVAQRDAETLRQQQIPLAAQIQRLQQERDEAKAQAATMGNELARIKTSPAELAKLRGELARLRGNSSDAGDPFVQTALTWKAKKARLKQLFQDKPEQNIPELQLLDDQAWLNAAINANLETDAGIRKAMSDLRMRAENQFAIQLLPALQNYAQTNNGQFPTDLTQLVPYLKSTVADDLVQRYQITPADQFPAQRLGGDWYITEKTAVDADNDQRWVIGQNGFGPTSFNPSPDEIALAPVTKILTPVLAAYSAANDGTTPTDLTRLQPYATTPAQQAALQQLLHYKPAIAAHQ